MDLCVAIAAYDTIFVNTKGPGHLLTFVLDATDSVFLAHLRQWLKVSFCDRSMSVVRLSTIYLKDISS